MTGTGLIRSGSETGCWPLAAGAPRHPAGQSLSWRAARPGLRRNRQGDDFFSVGLFVPLSSGAAVWGPSCLACAELAVSEINRAGGLQGREVRVITVDAGADPADVAEAADALLEDNLLDAIVGMHISAVRTVLAPRVGGRVPYIYTPLYEGGETAAGVYAIGETPEDQLLPALSWATAERRIQRWALIGNDYVWPRASHAQARRFIRNLGGAVAAEAYLPLGTEDFEPCLDALEKIQADAVLLSLVGQDAIAFNRAFGARGMHRRLLRLSMSIDEDTLLGIGAENTANLIAAAGYFTGVDTDANHAFIERYRSHFGVRAPVPSTLGQSIYEGFAFLQEAQATAPGRPVFIPGARGTTYLDNSRKIGPIYLAEADGVEFRLLPQARQPRGPLRSRLWN